MRPAIVSARTSRDFPRQKGQAPEYPRGRSVRRSAPSPQRFTGRPLRAAIMVELFARGVFSFTSRRASARRPVRPSPGRKLPTPAGLSEPRTTSRSNPPVRDLRAFARTPASFRHGLVAGAPRISGSARMRYVPVAPLRSQFENVRLASSRMLDFGPEQSRALASNKRSSSWTSESPRIQL